jgi:tetratricopeptide (TPR) repeat protein
MVDWSFFSDRIAVVSDLMSWFVLLAIGGVFAHNELQEVERLMKTHQFWDAAFRLSRMIDENPTPALVLLRARCFRNVAQFEHAHEDLLAILSGKPWIFTFSSSPPPSKLKLSAQPSKTEIAEAYALESQVFLDLGRYRESHDAAEHSGNATVLRVANQSLRMYTQAKEFNRSHEFKAATALYDSLAALSPRSLSVLARRTVLASLARNESHYRLAARDLIAAFPTSEAARSYLGIIHFCNCRFAESLAALNFIQLNKLMFRKQSGSKVSKRMTQWAHELTGFNQSLSTAEQMSGTEKEILTLIDHTSQICWPGSALMDRLFLIHIRKLKQGDTSKDEMLAYLSRYIYKSPHLRELYLERATVHFTMGETDASQYDVEMAKQLKDRFETLLDCCRRNEGIE